MNIVDQLRKARLDACLTQTTVAERAKIAQGQISAWENGKKNISLNNVTAWAKALGFAVKLEKR